MYRLDVVRSDVKPFLQTTHAFWDFLNAWARIARAPPDEAHCVHAQLVRRSTWRRSSRMISSGPPCRRTSRRTRGKMRDQRFASRWLRPVRPISVLVPTFFSLIWHMCRARLRRADMP
ncbi:hypothetical protein BRADI_1g43166v3 [Brachypodium distachyon]|uniref:Uncharacterized protein n=1 Tax=Brachypodium distachyon TaxID=15368 RepID=A0A2K2DP24_BRADI|nr:hypothetical protein BRADI_1g43166v3 [Brachypodium distachyon]